MPVLPAKMLSGIYTARQIKPPQTILKPYSWLLMPLEMQVDLLVVFNQCAMQHPVYPLQVSEHRMAVRVYLLLPILRSIICNGMAVASVGAVQLLIIIRIYGMM